MSSTIEQIIKPGGEWDCKAYRSLRVKVVGRGKAQMETDGPSVDVIIYVAAQAPNLHFVRPVGDFLQLFQPAAIAPEPAIVEGGTD